MLKGYKRICVNPALEMSKDSDVKVGNHQFEGITDFDRENCYGLFGDKDTDWGYCKAIFAEHYNHIHTFPGGHRMTDDEIEQYLMPLVKELIKK